MSDMTSKNVREIQMELCLGMDPDDIRPIAIEANADEAYDFPEDDGIHSLTRDDDV